MLLSSSIFKSERWLSSQGGREAGGRWLGLESEESACSFCEVPVQNESTERSFRLRTIGPEFRRVFSSCRSENSRCKQAQRPDGHNGMGDFVFYVLLSDTHTGCRSSSFGHHCYYEYLLQRGTSTAAI